MREGEDKAVKIQILAEFQLQINAVTQEYYYHFLTNKKEIYGVDFLETCNTDEFGLLMWMSFTDCTVPRQQ